MLNGLALLALVGPPYLADTFSSCTPVGRFISVSGVVIIAFA
jgi:hypothetical protein